MKKIIKNRWAKHYCSDNKNRYWNLTADSIITAVILTLIVANIYLVANDSGAVLGTQNEDAITDSEQPLVEEIIGQATTTADTTITEPATPTVTPIYFQAFARYYTADGEQLGRGPLPPVAGEPTRYWVFVNIGGLKHNLKNVLITATLPDNVRSTGRSSVTIGEGVRVNGQAVSWQIADLAVSAGTNGAAWEVEIIPSSANFEILLDNISFSAIDAITGEEINRFEPTVLATIQ